MKILITGGSGFIGTHLIKNLLENSQCELVTNIDLVESKLDDDRVKNHLLDIRLASFVNKIEEVDYDYCIHLAALCKEPGYEWEEYFETNHIGTKNVIALCEKLFIDKVFFTSTMMVFKAGEELRTESSITAPDTAYGVSKLLAEKELEKWKSSRPERVLKTIRPAVVFGENENANFTRLFKSLKIGFFPYVGKSSTIKSSIYVKELVSFIDFLILQNTKDDIFNFSFPDEQSIKSTIHHFKEVFELKSLNPVLPYKLLLFTAKMFEALDSIGIKNSIHHRRIQKLYHSTNIYPQNAVSNGYKFEYTLKSALQHWKSSGDPNIDSE